MTSLVDVEQHDGPVSYAIREPRGLYQKFLEQEQLASPLRTSQREVRDIEPNSKDSCGADNELLDCVLGPDIEWLPSYGTYLARVERLAAMNVPRSRELPEGYPKEILGPRCWTGSEFVDESKYVITLSQSEIREVEEALRYFSGKLS